jgi:predicted TIM-barrel fold metal-dependent hydrolase
LIAPDDRGAVTVDAHGHVWTAPDEHEWVTESRPAGTRGLVYPLDAFREDCAKTGADRAVLVATPHHGPGSPYVRECVAAHDDLAGVVTMDHAAPGAGERAATLLEAPGVVGVRFAGSDVTDVPESVWTALAARAAQAQVLTTADHLPAVERIADAHPDVTFVLDHLGAREGPAAGGEAYGRLGRIASHENVYVKLTSAPSDERFPHPDVHDHVRRLLEWFGPDRLLWGSDYVYRFRSVTPWQTREWLDRVPALSRADRRTVTERTAARLLDGR